MAKIKIGNKTVGNVDDADAGSLLGPAQALVPITKGVAMAGGACRRLWVGTAGTLNFTDFTGVARMNFPAILGENNIMVSSVEAGGTASDLWAMY